MIAQHATNCVSDEEFEFLLNEWQYLPRSIGRKHRFRAHEIDDMVNESMLKAWMYRKSFDPSRASFSTWFYNVCTTAAVRIREYEGRSIRKPSGTMVRLDAGREGRVMPITDRHRPERAGLDDVELVDSALSLMTDHQRSIAVEIMRGESPNDVGKRKGICRQAVVNSFQAGLASVRTAWGIE